MSSFWIMPLDAEAKERLRQVKIKIPRRGAKTRAPTPAELRMVLESFPGILVEYLPPMPRAGEPWQICLQSKKKSRTGPYALISGSNYPGEINPIPVIYVETGTLDAVAPLAIGLSKTCGTLVLDGEDSYGPHLVGPETKPEELIEAMTAFADEQLDGVPEEWR